MKCPRTGGVLTPIKVGGIEVDVSQECGGVFFDNCELDKFDMSGEVRSDALVNHLQQFEYEPLNLDKRINCPKCEDVVMMRRYESPAQIIELDECPQCAGIWLDTGELSKLRETRIVSAERREIRHVIREYSQSNTSSTPLNRHGIIYGFPKRMKKVFDIAGWLLS